MIKGPFSVPNAPKTFGEGHICGPKQSKIIDFAAPK